MPDDKPKDPYVPPRMSEEELQKIVLGLVSGRIFTASEAPVDLVGMIFMPLGLGGLYTVDWEQVGNVIEYMDKAGPRGVNGYPIFMSCQLIHKDDWSIIAERALATDEAMRAAAGGA